MKKIIFLTTLVIGLVVILHFATSIYTLWHKQDLLTKAQKQLQQEKTENANLKKQLTVVASQSFVEEEARNKLFMTKPTEQEVIIANDQIHTTTKASPQTDTRPYWQQWLSVFSL